MKHSKSSWAQGMSPPLQGEKENKTLGFHCLHKREICSSYVSGYLMSKLHNLCFPTLKIAERHKRYSIAVLQTFPQDDTVTVKKWH